MLRPGGYASVTEADGRISREGDTFTCAHGNELVRVPPGVAHSPNRCLRCMGLICDKCAATMSQTMRCVPSEQMLLNMESTRRFRGGIFYCAHSGVTVGDDNAPVVGVSACYRQQGKVLIPVGADPLLIGAWCRQCKQHICDDCATVTEATLRCWPFERKLIEMASVSRFHKHVATV